MSSPCAFTPSITPFLGAHLPNTKRSIRSHQSRISPNLRNVTRATLSEVKKVAGGGSAPTDDQFTRYDGKSYEGFEIVANQSDVRLVPLWRKVFSDQLTPVTAYRCLVSENDLDLSSFLLESVHTGERVGRYSYVGARPIREVIAYAQDVTVVCHDKKSIKEEVNHVEDPWNFIRKMTEEFKPAPTASLPCGDAFFSGGWVGYGGYDTMRYAELKSLPFSSAPNDDRQLPDLHLGLYSDVVVFDHVAKVVYLMHWVDLANYEDQPVKEKLRNAHKDGLEQLDLVANTILKGTPLSTLRAGEVTLNTDAAAGKSYPSNMTKEEFMAALDKIKHYIAIGDTFQTVFSQRFERWSNVDPFSVYRALRITNPSPYMIYMQCRGCNLVASSPEILTHVQHRILTNRPLAGTRRRGTTNEEDEVLAKDLLADGKDRSEHMMLVDLGRNDVGMVSEYGSVVAEKLMQVEKYSHVMHISSTVTGKLKEGMKSWDALRSTLPAGTISGAPKIRSMQIIDEVEPTKRGPYGGGIGYISFYDTMNMALALRTMVVPNKPKIDNDGKISWLYYLQAGAGIVYESDNEAEYTETVNKSMALNRAIDLAENAF